MIDLSVRKEVESLLIKERLSKELEDWLESEIFWLECNPSDWKKITSRLNGEKIKNKSNSTVLYILGITDEKPKTKISASKTVLPDVDFDTDGRDFVKSYLVDKYGRENVALLGTYSTLKVKGAIKDICRVIRPDFPPEEVNKLTKRCDVLNMNEFLDKPGSDFFYAVCSVDSEFKAWFEQNQDVKEAVLNLLGNAKNPGVHAGGIVISDGVEDIRRLVPVSYSKDHDLWVTQMVYQDVEYAGLVKYDILGVIVLNLINECFRLIKERTGRDLKLRDIPMDDPEVYEDFRQGKTESVFQFKTKIATELLKKHKHIDSIKDLANVTAINRPGPLKKGMDVSYIRRKNGLEKVSYAHKELEPILSDTYGIIIFQESVLKAVQALGDLSADDSLDVLKAMGKKQINKLEKYKDKFIENFSKKPGVSAALAGEIWETLAAFAEYGFNVSHAVAYSCTGYVCMWLKHYYPLEWMSASLTFSDKDDLRELYPRWKDKIKKPDINESEDKFIISGDKLVMPLSGINKVGPSAVNEVIKIRKEGGKFLNIEDFLVRVSGRQINKTTAYNLIFAGAFDSMATPGVSLNSWRKEILKKYFEARAKTKKPPPKERLEIEKLLNETNQLTKMQILVKELSLLDFTAFDYFDYFKEKLTNVCMANFKKAPVQPAQALEMEGGEDVLVAGAVESVAFIPTKTGKNANKMMCRIKISNNGHSIEVVAFAPTVEKDDRGGQTLRKLREFEPIVIKGRINVYNDSKSVILESAVVLFDDEK